MVTFRVPDMSCGRCAGSIARAIASVDAGARIEVDIPNRLVRITGEAAEPELATAMAEAGYPTQEVEANRPRSTGGGCCCG